MLNAQTYFETYDFTPLIEKLLKEFDIQSDDNHYQRHMIEIKKKIDDFKKSGKRKEIFKEMPSLDTDFSSYVLCILLLN